MQLPRRTKLCSTAALLIVLLASQACRIARGPAEFWKSYRPDLIADAHSDQGLWGGERWIVWRSSRRGALTFREAERFAAHHGWKLIGEKYKARNGVAQPSQSHEPAFLPVPSTVGRFESGWVREDPGTSQTSPAFGYVQVADDGMSMYIYHFWGNG